MTVNSLFPVHIARTGLGLTWLQHEVLMRARTAEQAVDIVTNGAAAIGYAWHIGCMRTKEMVTVETFRDALLGRANSSVKWLNQGGGAKKKHNRNGNRASHAPCSGCGVGNLFSCCGTALLAAAAVDGVAEFSTAPSAGGAQDVREGGEVDYQGNPTAATPAYFHANSLRHALGADGWPVPQGGGASTVARLKKFEEFQEGAGRPRIRSAEGLVEFLSDSSDPDYPVWRDAQTEADSCFTEVTGVYDLGARKMTVWSGNPLMCKESEYRQVYKFGREWYASKNLLSKP
jgi:hypothetical protein